MVDVGAVLDGKYQIKKILGKGGMGSVYEAEHTGTGRRCAVKVISSPEMIDNPDVVSRFQREARAAGAIDTQYITQVLDAGVDREHNLPFLAMEYMEGEDLQHFLKRVGPIAPELAMRIVAQTCLGLHKAHEQDVVHRDIKPHNLFLAQRDAGEVIIKLLDFGIAKVKMEQAQDKDGAGLTKTGNLLGSPLYVSPEQARGKRGIDHRTDIWSLGAVLYQMLTGQTPYQHATALGELILMVCTEPPPPLQEKAPWVPPEVAAIVHRCLEKDPAARFQSAEELFEAAKAMLPQGWTINMDMLVSLQESARLEQAPKLDLPPQSSFSASGSTGVGAATNEAPLSANGATTGGALAHTAPEAAGGGGSKTGIIVAAIAVAALGGTGIYFATRTDEPAKPKVNAVATGAPTSETTPEPTAVKTAVAAPRKELTVRVYISPEDAAVKVNGKDAKLSNGDLRLKGFPGDVFDVVVTKGTNSKWEGPVAVTPSGPVPNKIRLEIGKTVTVPRGNAGGGATKTDDPATPPPPPPGGVPKGVAVDTGEFGD